MWSLLPRRTQLLLIIGAGMLIAWAAEGMYAIVTGVQTGPLRWTSLAALVVGSGLTAAANWLWPLLWRTFPGLGRRLFPDLNGNWTGHLISTWIDPQTGQPIPPIDAQITIKLALFHVAITLKTGESKSYSTRALLEAFPDDGRFRIWYSYNNDPNAQVRHRSSPHEGVAFLECQVSEVGRLEGRYYTARKTTGDMEFTRSPNDRSV